MRELCLKEDKMSKNILKKINELISLAFQLKGKNHDLFVCYSPHVNSIDLGLHVNGWKPKKDADFKATLYLDYYKNDLGNDGNDLLGLPLENDVLYKIENAISSIKELIRLNEPENDKQ